MRSGIRLIILRYSPSGVYKSENPLWVSVNNFKSIPRLNCINYLDIEI